MKNNYTPNMIKHQWNKKHYVASYTWTSKETPYKSCTFRQVFNKCTSMLFKIILGQHHISLVQEWLTHSGTFHHMATFIVTQVCTTYFNYNFLLLPYFNFKTLVHGHGQLTGHSVDSSKNKVLPWELKWHVQTSREAIEIQLQKPSLNRDNDFELANIYDTILAPSRP